MILQKIQVYTTEHPILLLTLLFLCSLVVLALLPRRSRSDIPRLRGPSSDGFTFGNLESVREPWSVAPQWNKLYGRTFAVYGFLSKKRLYTTDPRTISYILNKSSEFGKPWQTRYGIEVITGPGLLVAEGAVHKRQRKILNPVFSPARIRALTPILTRKSVQLRDAWKTQVSSSSYPEMTIDVMRWFSRATLDAIGEIGFGYHFDSMIDDSNELAEAFYSLFNAVTGFNALEFLSVWFPVLGRIPTKANRIFKFSTQAIKRIGEDIVATAQRKVDARTDGEEEGMDLLAVLLESNTPDGPDGQIMTQEEVVAQIATILAAGHETTAAGLAWALYALAAHPEVQTKLRKEVLASEKDDLNALPYLDQVIRETLRVYPPVELTSRQPWGEEVLPLSEPIVDMDGRMLHELRLIAGDVIFIPLGQVNVSKEIWGEDALEFRPERWDNPPIAASAIPSVYANLSTFLAGPRACIGWRVALIEMKAFVYELVRTFHFEAEPGVVIERKLGRAVTRPAIRGREHEGNQLPLRVSLIESHVP